MKPRKLLTLVLPLAMVLGLAGCLFSPDPQPPEIIEKYKPQTSIQNVLENFILAYEDGDIDEYSKLFDQALFRFVFSPVDVGTSEEIPEWWLWGDEHDATKAMFEHELVDEIELEFTYADPWLAVEDDDPPQIGEDVWMTSLQTLELIVEQRNPELGEPDIFIVEGDRHDFFFRQDPDQLVDGTPIWKIIEWRDKSTGTGGGLLATSR